MVLETKWEQNSQCTYIVTLRSVQETTVFTQKKCLIHFCVCVGGGRMGKGVLLCACVCARVGVRALACACERVALLI